MRTNKFIPIGASLAFLVGMALVPVAHAAGPVAPCGKVVAQSGGEGGTTNGHPAYAQSGGEGGLNAPQKVAGACR